MSGFQHHWRHLQAEEWCENELPPKAAEIIFWLWALINPPLSRGQRRPTALKQQQQQQLTNRNDVRYSEIAVAKNFDLYIFLLEAFWPFSTFDILANFTFSLVNYFSEGLKKLPLSHKIPLLKLWKSAKES